MMNLCEVWNSPRTENTHVYALKNISPMENHPFGVRDDEDIEAEILRILNDWQRMRQRTWDARERDERWKEERNRKKRVQA